MEAHPQISEKLLDEVHSVAVFGAGLSGQAASRLAKAKGMIVTLFDQGGQGDRSEFSLNDVGVYDRFVFSPGFAADHPWRELAENSGRICQSEVGFAASFWKGRLVGVTGTNGKTSLTMLLRDAFQRAGFEAFAVGNIGATFSDLVTKAVSEEAAVAVCELSSFQAELPSGLKLDALLWTNFAEDHLDRYPDMATYFKAKAQLARCLQAECSFLIGEDVLEASKTYDVSLDHAQVVRLKSPQLDALSAESPFARMPQAQNYALAAALFGQWALPVETLRLAANRFELAAHRLQPCARFGGVTFWNDSKATNFHAMEAALTRMQAPVYWVGGGVSKGGDLAAFAQRIGPQIDCAFVYGSVGEALANTLREVSVPVEHFSSFADAVNAAADSALAQSPSAVLMSPGFASFDQFLTYAERGKSFISIVLSLMEARLIE